MIRYCLMAVFTMQLAVVFAQPSEIKALRYNPATRNYSHVQNVPVRVTSTDSSKKYVIAHKYVWVFPTTQIPAHWERLGVSTLSDRRAQKATYFYKVPSLRYENYTGPVTISVDRIDERTELLSKNIVSTEQLVSSSTAGRVDAYFAKTIYLGTITWNGNQPQLLVVDSLIIPLAYGSKSTFTHAQRRFPGSTRSFLKIIAGSILYESPAQMIIPENINADILYSAESITLKTIYPDLTSRQLSPSPPPLFRSNQNVRVLRQQVDTLENLLLNRLYVKLMQQTWTDLLTEEDEWLQDRLVNQFQLYRYKKIKGRPLATDARANAEFLKLVHDFELKYANRNVSKVRLLENVQILASGDNLRPLRYFAIPNVATVQPLVGDTTIGVVEFTGTGDANLKMSVEVELSSDSQALKNVEGALKRKGLVLEQNLDNSTLRIGEQPLRIGGVTVGKITPVSNRILRLDFDVTEGAASIARWFPKQGHPGFQVDAVAQYDPAIITQQVALHLDRRILDKLDYAKPLDRFQVFERTPLTGELKLSSNLSAFREREGALNFVEVVVNIQHGDRSSIYGPFRLSSYNTIAAEKIIPFVKYTDTFKAVISGRAVYDNGEIIFNPFERTSPIVVLDDAILNSSQPSQ